MSLYLSDEEGVIQETTEELKKYLQIMTGKKVTKSESVAFALYYTISTLPSDSRKQEVIKDVEKVLDSEFVKQVIERFKRETRPDIEEVLKKYLE